MRHKPPLELAVDYALLVLLAMIFGMSFVWGKIAVREVPPATIVLCRLLLASGILYAVSRIMGERLLPLMVHWRKIAIVGLFGSAFPFFLITWGQEQVDAGLTAILMAVMPLITIVLAHYFTDGEELTIYRIVGFVCGLVGVAVLFGIENLTSLGDETIRQTAIIGAAVCYAINAIVSKSVVTLPRFALSTAVLLVPALMMLPFVVIFDGPWKLDYSAVTLWSIVALGAFPTGLGMVMIFAILGRQGAGFLSQINFLVPVFGAAGAMLFLGEAMPPNGFLSLAIILAGVAIARIKPKPKPVETI